MKRLIACILILISFTTYAQQKDSTIYPYIQKTPKGKIEYVFTYEQANIINDNITIIAYLDSIVKKYADVDTININIIDGKNKNISKLYLIIDNNNKAIINRELAFKKINADIDLYKKENKSLREEKAILQQKIKIKNLVIYSTIPTLVISVFINYILLRK